jgi:hypothetical protein
MKHFKKIAASPYLCPEKDLYVVPHETAGCRKT